MEYLALFAGVVLALGVFFFVGRLEARWKRRFNEQWPPIDDDEFVRRCGAGVSRDKALKVRRIIAEQLGIPYERIHPEQSLVDDLEAD